MLAPQRVTPALKRSAGAHRPANPTRRALPLYTPTPRRVDARGVSRAGGVASGIAVAIAIAHTPSPLYAVGTQLADDSAVMIGSDGVIYSLALDSAVATAGDTISGATFDYTVTGLEADPTTNTLYAINQSADANVLASIDYSSGISTLIESDYGPDEALDALDRTEDGSFFLAHVPDLDGATAHLSTLDATTGVYTEIGTTDLAGGGG
jgi:hypothetical protein